MAQRAKGDCNFMIANQLNPKFSPLLIDTDKGNFKIIAL